MKWKILGPLIAASVLAAVLPAEEAHAKWYWVPSRITNGSPGRAVLTRDPDGVVGKLLSSIGLYYSHSGMFVDSGYNIRHNTADPDKLKVVDSSGRGCPTGFSTCIPYSLNGDTLTSAQPGIITQSVANAFGAQGHPEFNFYDQENNGTLKDRNALVLLRRDVQSIGGSIYYTGAANKMRQYEAYYSFYSYTDIWQTEPDPTDPTHIHVAADGNRRNMCSGTIAWALFSGGGFDVWPWFYSAAVRNSAAPVLHRAVRDRVGKSVPNTASTAFIGSMLLGPGGGGTLAVIVAAISDATKDRIANQMVNCMAFNDCYNTGTRWKNGVGDGMSLAPDNLVPVGRVIEDNTSPLNQAWGMSGWDPANTWTKWYDAVEDILYTGGYWEEY
jgi:hypothetical protein